MAFPLTAKKASSLSEEEPPILILKYQFGVLVQFPPNRQVPRQYRNLVPIHVPILE